MKKSIKIFGNNWTIKYVDVVDKEDSLGDCSPDKKIIQIRNDLPKRVKDETLLHEILHAMLYEVGIECQDIPLKSEHFIINSMVLYLANDREFKNFYKTTF